MKMCTFICFFLFSFFFFFSSFNINKYCTNLLLKSINLSSKLLGAHVVNTGLIIFCAGFTMNLFKEYIVFHAQECWAL